MKKLLIFIIIVLSILVIAAVSNPSREEFINWGVTEIRRQAESDFERIFGGAVAGPMLELQTEADNYVFFSIFKVRESDEQARYLGIFGNFISLN